MKKEPKDLKEALLALSAAAGDAFDDMDPMDAYTLKCLALVEASVRRDPTYEGGALANQKPAPRRECPECEKNGGPFVYPRHVASLSCQSGRRPHCTCSTCF